MEQLVTIFDAACMKTIPDKHLWGLVSKIHVNLNFGGSGRHTILWLGGVVQKKGSFSMLGVYRYFILKRSLVEILGWLALELIQLSTSMSDSI